MFIIYLYFQHHETNILSREIKLRGEAICNNLATSAEDLLVMKDDLGLAKLVYDTKTNNTGVIYSFIIDEDQTIWAHTDISLVNKQYQPPPGLKKLDYEQILMQPYKMADQTAVFEIAMPITVGQTKIGAAYVAISQEAVQNAITGARKGVALVTIVILLIGIIGILLLVSVIIGSLGNLTQDIEAIGDGDLDRRIITSRKDEIGRITSAVGIMTQKLKKARAELIEKERMKKEMQIAKEIQQSILPRSLPQIPGLEIDTYYQAAREVGGDYYDLIKIDNEHFGVLVSDVSGKGVPGSLVMSMTRSIIQIEALKNPSPHGLLTEVHATLSKDIPEGLFITMFYIVFDLTEHTMDYCCAGHNPAYLYNANNNELAVLKPDGPPLGISLFDKETFAAQLIEEKRTFEPGEMLFLYTDGVTEAMNSAKEQFSEERLEHMIKEHGKLKPGEFKKILSEAVESFTGNEPQSDDITFIILQQTIQDINTLI
jgi:serine phosphatase RsbU (regulator of sigma subunit)